MEPRKDPQKLNLKTVNCNDPTAHWSSTEDCGERAAVPS